MSGHGAARRRPPRPPRPRHRSSGRRCRSLPRLTAALAGRNCAILVAPPGQFTLAGPGYGAQRTRGGECAAATDGSRSVRLPAGAAAGAERQHRSAAPADPRRRRPFAARRLTASGLVAPENDALAFLLVSPHLHLAGAHRDASVAGTPLQGKSEKSARREGEGSRSRAPDVLVLMEAGKPVARPRSLARGAHPCDTQRRGVFGRGCAPSWR